MSDNPLHGHGSAKDAPAPITEEEKLGLTTEQAEAQVKEWGYNELPEVQISKLKVFLLQFTGTMPYMLELALIICLIVTDYTDFGIILVMLLSNGILGYHEQMKAADSLAELTQKMETKIAVLRDGAAEHLLTRLLVPGDVVLLVGGCAVPADVEWFEGDVLQVNTAAMTGEPLPRKYPGEHGNLILCGTSIQAGEAYAIVRKTGIHTEIGSTNMEIAKDKTQEKKSELEQKVLRAVQVIITVSLIDVIIIFFVQGVARKQFNSKGSTNDALLSCLSIIIAAIPIALPIVMQVTMALGAGMMAKDHNAVVTSLPALQDISSMTVLCSDKTGTLTTAKITIHADSVWTCGDFTRQDVALYGALASNRDKKEDPIDRSVIQHFDRLFGPRGLEITNEYTKVRSVGFNPIYKRVLFQYTHPKHGKITIAKGLATKVLDTADHGVDDAADQWKCENFEKLQDIVKKTDYDFSKAGYKTLGVAVQLGDGPFKFCGILPMLDPPRHDSAQTVKNLKNAGINVKMITGDHLNIAKETCRLIGMGQNIHPGEATRNGTHERNELVLHADGFAQVLPKDKREVVLVLRDTYKQIVGMTGDGVNDAPALSAAQCGVAVDDATDAAKNASAIILTTPGLSAIYSGVVESRRIFRKLKAYVTYRFAASIQIVVVLTLLIYISQCPINSLYIILLALFNDLTMLPIAYDCQLASSLPENPDVNKMLTVSGLLGLLETAFTLLLAYVANDSHIFSDSYSVGRASCSGDHGARVQAVIWLQMFISTELLIFSARAPTYFFFYLAPHKLLILSVTIGCVAMSLLANLSKTFGNVPGNDIAIIWAYCILCLFIIDACKVQLLDFLGENSETLPETPALEGGHGGHNEKSDVEAGKIEKFDETSKSDAQVERLSEFAMAKSDRLSQIDPKYVANRAPSKVGRESISVLNYEKKRHETDRGSVSARMVHNGSVRPNTPAYKTVK